MEEKILKSMRGMAWERAKGELQSTLHTFWGDDEQFKALSEAIDDFVKKVTDDGLMD